MKRKLTQSAQCVVVETKFSQTSFMKFFTAIAVSSLLAVSAFGQGTVYFNNFVAGVISTRVYSPEPGSPTVPRTGNTSSDFPAGTQTYGGTLLSGTNYTAQMWAIPGADQP